MLGIYHLIALALFVAFAAVDLAATARVFPEVPNWKLKGIPAMVSPPAPGSCWNFTTGQAMSAS